MAKKQQTSSRGVPRKARKTSILSSEFRAARRRRRIENSVAKHKKRHEYRMKYFKQRREYYGGMNLAELRRSYRRAELKSRLSMMKVDLAGMSINEAAKAYKIAV